ncbi:TIGR02147 family protein [Bdellovibrio sp. HCB-110]|uniref:TIGR02147 family protein n=1 Tax=Bdellovibrio sp. HCB-110 TaxID=3391182 RepID=UPI0039B65135
MQKYDSQALEQSLTLSEFLQAEFMRRLKKNPSYSLRAYARDLEMNSSLLSEVLNNKRGISQKTLLKLSEKFRMTKSHQEIFNDLFLAQSSKSQNIKKNAQDRLKKSREKHRIKRLDKQTFKILSDWYHAAILELTEITEFKNDSAWIAKKLGISTQQAEDAIERLLQVGLIQEVNGTLKAQPDIVLTNSETTFEAIKQFHRQTLQKAALSFEKDAPAEREFNSMILAIPKEELPELKKQIQIFMQKFWQGLADKPKDDLYCMNIQFFPVARKVSSKSLLVDDRDI